MKLLHSPKFIGLSVLSLSVVIAFAFAVIFVLAALAGGDEADLVIGEVSGSPGDTVGIDIIIDTQDIDAAGFALNLAFDGITIPVSTGRAGPQALPTGWTLQVNEAAPGDLRFLALDISGNDVPLSGRLMHADFTISSTASLGPVAITASLIEIITIDGDLIPVNISSGVVNVVAPLSLNSVVILSLPPEFDSAVVTPRTITGFAIIQPLTVIATLTDGSFLDITSRIIWVSTNPAVATVSSTGVVSFVSPGDASIEGTVGP